MLKKLIILFVFQLLAVPVFASEETIAKKQNAVQHIEKLKEHIPVPELQKIITEYISDEYIPKILDQKKRIVKAALSKNGVYLISSSTMSDSNYHSEGTAKIWKFENGAYKLTHEMAIPLMVYNVAISNDGKYIAFEPNSTEVDIWELKDNRYSKIQSEKNLYQVSSVLEFFGHSKMLGRATINSINIWELSSKTNTFLRQSNFDFYIPGVTSADFSPNGRYIAVGSYNGNINLWKPSKARTEVEPFNTFETRISHPRSPRIGVTISPDAEKLAAYRYGVEFFQIENDSLTPFQLLDQYDEVRTVKFSPDSSYVALETFEKPIDVWKLNPKLLKYEKSASIIPLLILNQEMNRIGFQEMNIIGFSPNNSIITVIVNPVNNNHELAVWENQKEQLEQDTGEKIKTATEQEQTVVTEVD